MEIHDTRRQSKRTNQSLWYCRNWKKVGKFPSQTDSKLSYLVQYDGHEPTCNCPDCQKRKSKCKHVFAVEFYLRKAINKKGELTEVKGVRFTYAQNWSAYNKAQTNEKLIFLKLLKDLCLNVEQPTYKFGRPTLPFSDMLFGSIMKVYTGFSLRRFMSDMKIAKEMGLVEVVPSYSTISNFMNREEIKPILDELGLERYCCRSLYSLGHVDLIDTVSRFKKF